MCIRDRLYTAINETEINKIFKLDHHHIGDKKRKGVSTQWAKHKELDVAPKISEFFNSITFILTSLCKRTNYFYFTQPIKMIYQD